MGYGDDIMATGLARGMKERGKRAAFGDGKKIIWGPWSAEMFKYNPNVAIPGSEGSKDLEWIGYYKGKRNYNTQANGKWIWNYEFSPTPGQFYFDDRENEITAGFKEDFVVVEPNVPWQKSVAGNKDWGQEKYQDLTDRLIKSGVKVVQFGHKNTRRFLQGAKLVTLGNFRQVIAALSRARLYVGPEGGMHHASAAVGIHAVVLFGGFIPPQVTGYQTHVNLTGTDKACGNLTDCAHCREAMQRITVDEVEQRVRERLP